MFEVAELILHHGGTFEKNPKLSYINGEVEVIDIDPDKISSLHLMKYIKEDRYGQVVALYFKAVEQSLEMLELLYDDHSTLRAVNLASRCGKVDIYVDHGIQEAEVVPNLFLPSSIPECDDDDCEIDAEPIDETDVEENIEHFLSDDDEEVREVRRIGKQQIEEDNDGAENTNNDEDMQQAGGDSGFEDIPQAAQSGGDSGCEDMAEFCEDYDSDDPPSYETGSEDNVNDVGDHSSKVKFPSYNPKVYPPLLEAGLLFEDSNQFKAAIISYAVYTKRNLRFSKNEPSRIRVKCKENCPFYCCGRWDQKYCCFQLRRITDDHRCNTAVKLGIVSQKWLEDKYEDKVIGDPTIGIVELKKHIESELKISLTVSMVRRAIRSIVKKVNAGFDDQFKRLRDYAQECLNSNPGSTIIVETSRVVENAPCTFQRIYVCFGALKRGFAQGCRKVIGLDGCFLKGKLKGEILSAVGRDANNQMYPVAWAVVEIENTDSWRWFLTLLKDDLDMSNTSEWTLLSDQQKGLTTVIQKLFPEAEHRNCARHIHANWSKKHRGMVFKKQFWKCAKATTPSQFDEVVKELAKRDPKASEDLLKYPPKLWCKAFFRTNVKCDAVDNNMSEAFNGTIVKARSKPIVPMLEDIRVAMMRRIAEKRRSLDKWKGNHGHIILKKLNQNVLDSVGWHVDFNGVDGFEVKQGKYQFKVKLLERTCSCRAWDLSGIPCIHGICAIFDRKRDPVDYVHQCYSKEMYQLTYSHALEPINGELFWPRTECEEIRAPIPRRMTGRPKKRRNREETEPRHSKTKMSRKGGSISCSMCKESGHNKRFCPKKTTEPTSVSLNSSQAGK